MDIPSGSYVTVNSVEGQRSIVMTAENGDITNVFDKGERGSGINGGSYIFQPLPAGEHQVQWNGFGFDLTVIQERSTPYGGPDYHRFQARRCPFAVDFALDCAWGKEENDFELVLSGASTIDAGAYVYVDGSECGGVVDAMEDQLTAGVSTLTYSGRTWHGVLANKILEPDRGRDYLTVSGTASTVIGSLISRVGLDSVFDAVVPPDGSGDPTIKQYQFDRYTDCYTGLRRMCAANGLKLRLAYTSGQVNICRTGRALRRLD